MFKKSLSSWIKKSSAIRQIHHQQDPTAERTKALRDVSKSLYLVGQQRFEAAKTATNVYEHFKNLTISIDDDIKPSERLKDFEEIHSVTLNFGTPEMADQMSGSIYMHASMVEDKSSQCLRLAEDVPSFSITDLAICLTCMVWWSTEASHSLALREVVTKLDKTCVDRLASLHFILQDQLRLGYQWQCLLFNHKSEFPQHLLQTLASSLVKSSLPVIISYLLILSAVEEESKVLTQVAGQEVADKLEPALPFLCEAELIASYAGLRRLRGGVEQGVRAKLERTFGYRLQ